MDDNYDANSWEQLSDGVEEEIYTGPRDQVSELIIKFPSFYIHKLST